MKEPEKPWPPREWEYEHDHTEVSLFYKEYLTNEDMDEEEYLEDWKDQNDWEEGQPLPVLEYASYNNEVCTLADLIAKVPEGVPHNKVVVEMNRDRMYTYIGVGLTFKKPTNKRALKKSYEKACEEYKLKEEQYQKDLAEYQQWKKQNEILELEERLAKLKG